MIERSDASPSPAQTPQQARSAAPLSGGRRVASLQDAAAMAGAQDMRIDPGQEPLTAARLIPAMPAILACLGKHRAAVDQVYEARRRRGFVDSGSPMPDPPLSAYPIGYCRHIRDDVWHRALADAGFRALLAPGTILRKVFILLKGQYFQNAMQVGNLYIDVANDTVWVHKPKLEWMHVSEVDYRNVETWEHFAGVAERYLNVTLYPNLLFPGAFAVSPFFAVHACGRIDLLFSQDALFLKDLAEGMPRITALLGNDALMGRRLPRTYEELLHRTFGEAPRPGFPLRFVPCDVNSLRRGVVAEFSALREQPAERAVATVDHYMRAIALAARYLTGLNLVPTAAAHAKRSTASLAVRAIQPVAELRAG